MFSLVPQAEVGQLQGQFQTEVKRLQGQLQQARHEEEEAQEQRHTLKLQLTKVSHHSNQGSGFRVQGFIHMQAPFWTCYTIVP